MQDIIKKGVYEMSKERIKGMLRLLQDHGYTLVDLGELLELAENLKVDDSSLVSIPSSKDIKKKNLEIRITNLLKEIGIPASLKGYHYIRQAVMLTYNDNSYISKVTTKLYPSIAKTFNTTTNSVERFMRYAIEIAWNRGNAEVLNKYFGYTINATRGKPTNREFIAMMVDYLQLHS